LPRSVPDADSSVIYEFAMDTIDTRGSEFSEGTRLDMCRPPPEFKTLPSQVAVIINPPARFPKRPSLTSLNHVGGFVNAHPLTTAARERSRRAFNG